MKACMEGAFKVPRLGQVSTLKEKALITLPRTLKDKGLLRGHQGRPEDSGDTRGGQKDMGLTGPLESDKQGIDLPGLSCPLKDWAKRNKAP